MKAAGTSNWTLSVTDQRASHLAGSAAANTLWSMSSERDDAVLERLLDSIRENQRVASVITEDDLDLLSRFGDTPQPRAPDISEKLNPIITSLSLTAIALPMFNATSRSAVGRLLHRAIGKTVRRDTVPLAQQTQAAVSKLIAAFSTGLTSIVAAMDRSLEQIVTAQLSFEAQQKRSDQRLERLNARLNTLEGLTARLNALEERTATVISTAQYLGEFVSSHTFAPTFSNIAFADRFRGTRSEILDRYHDVAELLLDRGGPVLDLGCGRGELVELIVSMGGDARGVEVDPELVRFCRGIFLDVREANAMDALLAEADDSLGGIALIQVVEHLTPQQLSELIPVALQKLRSEGVLVAETVNGTSLFVYTRSFYCDPTHSNPVHHEYLTFLLEQAGFSSVEVQWRSPVLEADKIAPLDVPLDTFTHDVVNAVNAVNAVNDRIEQINRFLYTPQDYLVVAQK